MANMLVDQVILSHQRTKCFWGIYEAIPVKNKKCSSFYAAKCYRSAIVVISSNNVLYQSSDLHTHCLNQMADVSHTTFTYTYKLLVFFVSVLYDGLLLNRLNGHHLKPPNQWLWDFSLNRRWYNLLVHMCVTRAQQVNTTSCLPSVP